MLNEKTNCIWSLVLVESVIICLLSFKCFLFFVNNMQMLSLNKNEKGVHFSLILFGTKSYPNIEKIQVKIAVLGKQYLV